MVDFTIRTKKFAYWWNKDIASLRSIKQSFWRAFKVNKNNDNLILYKKATTKFKRAVKHAKKVEFETFTQKISPISSPKSIWRNIKLLTGVPNPSISIINRNNNIISERKKIADLFALNWSLY